MPVFDIYALARSAGRFLLYVGLFTFVVTTANTIFNILNNFSGMINNSIDAFNGLVSGVNGGSGGLGCLGFFMSGLGIDIVLSSFFVSAIGLLVAWTGAIITLYSIYVSLYFKTLLISAVR